MNCNNINECAVFTKDKRFCSGCGACAATCRHNAITMSMDEEGFLYPMLDDISCVKCGLCNIICPFIGASQENKDILLDCKLATTQDKRFYKFSATIGVCTMLSERIINNGGYVFGAYLNEIIWKVHHICVKTREDLNLIKNSKYAQSELGTSFIEIKQYLNKKKTILFIGTPCQVAGLKSFLKKSYDNLYTIDLVCHGVYSNHILQKEIEYWQRKLGYQIFNFRFRSKRKYDWVEGGVINFDYKDISGCIHHVEYPGCASPTYYCYAYSKDGINYNLRPSCYNCAFRSEKRYGDITVGDSWLIKPRNLRETFFFDYKNGTSIILMNTNKGRILMNKILSNLNLLPCTIEQVFVQPALLKVNKQIPKQRREIYGLLNSTEEYGTGIERLLSVNFDDEYEIFNKRYKSKCTKRIVKRVFRKIILRYVN